jgi:hypothetical protein
MCADVALSGSFGNQDSTLGSIHAGSKCLVEVGRVQILHHHRQLHVFGEEER